MNLCFSGHNKRTHAGNRFVDRFTGQQQEFAAIRPRMHVYIADARQDGQRACRYLERGAFTWPNRAIIDI